jgi:tetratricopeptide (TPR) repeat protein
MIDFMGTRVEKLESLIRESRFEEAEKKLRAIRKVDRQSAVAIANIARRINQPGLALRILSPYVRPTIAHNRVVATPAEKLEYAEALRRVGAIDEAWQLLQEVDEDQNPQASLYKTFCLFNQWKYREAIPILAKYLKRTDLEDYARAVGEINLAAALIQVGSLDEAETLLQRIRESTRASGYILLYGNSLELSAQLLILRKDFDGALAILRLASESLKGSGKIFSLFAEKWSAIAESMKQNRCTPELLQVFAKAKAAMHWESVRDCDLFIALLNRDSARLQHLYFGTPFESFRQRVLHFDDAHFQMPKTYVWCAGPMPSQLLNLATGRLEGRKSGHLPTGQALHRFLILLCRDLYRPLLTFSAFGKLFPGEFMNAQTSANRIHQVVKRCREWIAQENLDLRIEETDGGYQLFVGEKTGVILPCELLPLESAEIEWLLLKTQVGNHFFNIQQAQVAIAGSASKTLRLLRWALEQGRVQKVGKGPSTMYQVRPTTQTEG